jgi:hypothetical protein
MIQFITKIRPNTAVKDEEYILDTQYGLCRALKMSSRGASNLVECVQISTGIKRGLFLGRGEGLYKISLNGRGIGQGVDEKKALSLIFR